MNLNYSYHNEHQKNKDYRCNAVYLFSENNLIYFTWKLNSFKNLIPSFTLAFHTKNKYAVQDKMVLIYQIRIQCETFLNENLISVLIMRSKMNYLKKSVRGQKLVPSISGSINRLPFTYMVYLVKCLLTKSKMFLILHGKSQI